MDFPFWQIIGFPLREEVTPRNLRMENNCWKPCFSTQNALGTQDLWAYGETQSHNTKKTLWTQHTRVDSIRANVTCMTSPSRGPMLNRIQLRHIYIYIIYIYYIHTYIYITTMVLAQETVSERNTHTHTHRSQTHHFGLLAADVHPSVLHVCVAQLLPIGSMYGIYILYIYIYANIGGVLMVNVCKCYHI